MDQPWLAMLATLLKSLQAGGNNNDSIRHLIQEELRKSQNQENSQALRQMLTIIEQKHAAQLEETNREKDRLKMQVEFLSKQVHELNREKKSAEKTDKMKDLLNHLAELKIGNQQRPAYNSYQNQNAHTSQSYNSQGKNNSANLPWMDPPKGKMYPHQSADGQPPKHFQKKNFHTDASSKQNFQNNPKFQHNKHKQHAANVQSTPDFQYNQNMQHFQNNPKFQHNKHKQHAANVQSTPDFQCNQNMQHSENFQQKQYVQHPQRGQPSNRYRGGQRGATGRGRGRSSSVGRNRNQLETEMNNTTLGQATSSFHIQVTKVGGQQWVSTENISAPPNVSSQRGRGNFHGRGRGRGRGHGNAQQGEHGGGQSTVRKNRKKNLQTGGNTDEKKPPRNKNINEGDPEDNCRVS